MFSGFEMTLSTLFRNKRQTSIFWTVSNNGLKKSSSRERACRMQCGTVEKSSKLAKKRNAFFNLDSNYVLGRFWAPISLHFVIQHTWLKSDLHSIGTIRVRSWIKHFKNYLGDIWFLHKSFVQIFCLFVCLLIDQNASE